MDMRWYFHGSSSPMQLKLFARDGEYLPNQPDQTLGGGVLLLLQFVQDERLQSLGLGGSCQQPVPHFLLRISELAPMVLKEEDNGP